MRAILIAEDDRKTAELIRLYLEKDGYHVHLAADGQRALRLAREHRPDLMVLDLMLPELDGLEVCRRVREELDLPIIMLTARSTELDTLTGLELGADDYVTKPFSPRELLARIRTVLRRAHRAAPEPPAEAQYGDLRVDFRSHQAWVGGQPVRLTPKEFRLLAALMAEPGRTFTRVALVERAFGLRYEGLDRTVDVHLMNLRRKIEPDPALPRYVQTVYGVGYRFGPEVTDVA